MFCCNVCSKEFAFFVFAHFGNLKGYLEVNCKVCFCLWSHKKQCSIDISLFVWKVSYLIRTDVCFLNNKLSSKSHSSENRFGQHQKCSLDLFVSITILKHRVNKLCTSSTFGQVLLLSMLYRINDSITQGVCICACVVCLCIYPHKHETLIITETRFWTPRSNPSSLWIELDQEEVLSSGVCWLSIVSYCGNYLPLRVNH